MLEASEGRTFLWLHVGGPHVPYYDVDREDIGRTLHPQRYRRVWEQQVTQANERQMREYERIYERYVAFLDGELGRFIQGVKADGNWDGALVILTADHGERFKVGTRAHGYGTIAEDVTHVPLVIKAPAQRERVRLDTPAATIDVVPTILAAVYRPNPPGFPGRPLLPAPAPSPRTLYTWARYEHFVEAGVAGAIAAYRHPYKYAIDYSARRESLYDLSQDPEAVKDVQQQHPQVFRALQEDARRTFTP
jgi:arylsulfatase A-like enzyme